MRLSAEIRPTLFERLDLGQVDTAMSTTDHALAFSRGMRLRLSCRRLAAKPLYLQVEDGRCQNKEE